MWCKTLCALAFLAYGIPVDQAQSWESPSLQVAKPAAVPTKRSRPKRLAIAPVTARECTAWAVVAEAGKEPFRGKAMVAHTLKRRAERNGGGFGGSDICRVAQAKLKNGRSQYSGIHKMSLAAARRSPAWREALLAADEVLLRGYNPGPHWINATYYLNPKYSDKVGWCWFKRHLVVVGQYGDHLFHREPETAQDLARMAQDLPKECGGKAVYAQR